MGYEKFSLSKVYISTHLKNLTRQKQKYLRLIVRTATKINKNKDKINEIEYSQTKRFTQKVHSLKNSNKFDKPLARLIKLKTTKEKKNHTITNSRNEERGIPTKLKVIKGTIRLRKDFSQ